MIQKINFDKSFFMTVKRCSLQIKKNNKKMSKLNENHISEEPDHMHVLLFIQY